MYTTNNIVYILIMKISTKKGDKGETDLIGGKRVSKNNPTINLLGEIDELNSSIGIALHYITCSKVRRVTTAVQNDLFIIGSILANPNDTNPHLDHKKIEYLEEHITLFESRVGELKNFILPGGCKSASFLFQARSICRRVERTFVAIHKNEKYQDILEYLNRLSDLLFMCARKENNKQKIKEITVSGH